MTKQEYIYNELKHLIITNEYKENELFLSEAEICKKFDVSREPVRRALRRLIDRGFLNVKRGKGYFVNSRDFYSANTLLSLSQEEGEEFKVTVKLFEISQKVPEEFEDVQEVFHYQRVLESKSNRIVEEGYLPKMTLFDDFSEKDCAGSIIHYFEEKKELDLTHANQILKSKLIPKDHLLNQGMKEKITTSIQTQNLLYSNTDLIQISYQLKYDDVIKIVNTK